MFVFHRFVEKIYTFVVREFSLADLVIKLWKNNPLKLFKIYSLLVINLSSGGETLLQDLLRATGFLPSDKKRLGLIQYVFKQKTGLTVAKTDICDRSRKRKPISR